GFRLAPRLNAPGRLGDAAPALELLLAPDRASADGLASVCEQANARRQLLQQEVLAAAIAQVEQGEAGEAGILVAAEGWHPGVVGIVAAKLVDRFCRPAAVLAGEAGVFRGSVRAARGLHAQRALGACAAHLVRYGGHEGAAGLTALASELP